MFLSKLSLVSGRSAHQSSLRRTAFDTVQAASTFIPNGWPTKASGTASVSTTATSTSPGESAPLTRTELIKEVATTHELTKAAAGRIVSTVLDSIVGAVKDERGVELSKFGSFDSYMSKPCTKRNPKTGAKIDVPSKKRIRFKAFKSFQNTVRSDS